MRKRIATAVNQIVQWIGNQTSNANTWSAGITFSVASFDGGFSSPRQMAIDTVNNAFYVVDQTNHRVQKFTLSTGAFVGWIGKISTTGGTCTAGTNVFSGGWCSGGTSASGTGNGMFSFPLGISIDATNDALYVADGNNARIQKFTLSSGAFVGWIGKIATTGGTCTAGTNVFSGGWCSGGTSGSGTGDGMLGSSVKEIRVDVANDYLYVADYGNSRISKYVLSTGAFSGWIGKIATTGGTCTAGVGLFTGNWCSGGTSGSGSGDGMLNSPKGLVLDITNDFLYVADSTNARIQKFVLSTGAFVGWIGKIATTGGTCTAGANVFTGGWCSGGTSGLGTDDGMYSSPESMAVDSTNDFLYVADTSNARIQKFVLSTGAFVGWIGKIATTGGTCTSGINTFTGGWCSGGTSGSGTGDGMFLGNSNISIDGSANALYVTDSANARLQKFNLTTGAFVGAIGGVIYQRSPWSSGGTASATTGKSNGTFNTPYNITIDSTNNAFYVVDQTNHRIQKFALSTGAFVGWLGKISTTGGTCTAGVNTFSGGWCSGGTSISGTGDGMLSTPNGIALDVSGDLMYVTDNTNQRVQKFQLSTGAFIGWIGKIATTGGTCTAGVGAFTGGWCSGGTSGSGTGDGMFSSPGGIAIDTASDSLYVVDKGNARIQKFVLSTGAFVGWIGKIATTGGTCTAGTNVFSGGWCSGGVSGTGADDGMLNIPQDVALDSTNNALYVTDMTNARIQKFNLATGAFSGWIGKISTVGGTCNAGVGLFTGGWCSGGRGGTGTGDGMLNSPSGIVIDTGADSLYVVDNLNHRLQKFVLSTGVFVGWMGKISATGGTCNAGVGLFTGGWCSGGTSGSGSGDGMFNSPAGIAINLTSKALYVCDRSNQRIQKISQ